MTATVGGFGMEQRMADAESNIDNLKGDVRELQGWRKDVVKPFLDKSETHQTRAEKFMTTFEAVERERMEVQEERHRSNSLKLNFLLVIAAFLSLLFTALLILVTYQVAHNRSLLDLPAHSDNRFYFARRHAPDLDSDIPATIAMHGGYQ